MPKRNGIFFAAIPNLKLSRSAKPKHECHERANSTNFSKIIGKIRQIRVIRVKNACRKKYIAISVRTTAKNQPKMCSSRNTDFEFGTAVFFAQDFLKVPEDVAARRFLPKQSPV
jgi:hypothetical protein